MKEFYFMVSKGLQEDMILHNKMYEHLKEVKKLDYMDERFVFLGLQGSQNYNLSNEKSDVDTKLLLMPSVPYMALNKKPVSSTHVLSNNEHLDLKDFRLYMDTLRKQNVNFVEMLFTDYYFLNSLYESEWKELIAERERIARMDPNRTVRAMTGIASNKYKVYKNEISEGFDPKIGYDSKQVYQMARVTEFLQRYTSNAESYADLLHSRQRDTLLDLKAGKLEKWQADKLMDDLMHKVKELHDNYANVNRPVDKEMDCFLNEMTEKMFNKYLEVAFEVKE